MNKRILFLEPSGPETNFFMKWIGIPLLGPVSMATKLKKLGYNVKVLKENMVSKSILLKELNDSDVLVLTLLTNTAYRGYEIAKLFKSKKPRARVIAGGIHVSLLPEEAAEYADHAVIGEGMQIIKDLVDGQYKERIVKSFERDDLNTGPVPDFSLMVNSKKIKRIPIITSLGCPHACTFCCVTKMYGRRYRTKRADKTIKELRHQLKFFNGKRVFFYDDNFCADRKNTLELFEKIKDNNIKFQWGCQVRADAARDELFVKEMADAGCYRVHIGFESIDNKTLKDLKKRETLYEIENAIRTFHKYGISIHGMFILGMDTDGPEIFETTAKYCIEKEIEHAQFLSITPFPGTELYKTLDKRRLLHRDWNILDGFHANIAPANITEYQLIKGLLYAHEKIYSWRKIFSQFISDFQFILKNRNRKVLYSIQKMVHNFFRSIGFRSLLKKWKTGHREYHEQLRVRNLKSRRVTKRLYPFEFINKHSGKVTIRN